MAAPGGGEPPAAAWTTARFTLDSASLFGRKRAAAVSLSPTSITVEREPSFLSGCLALLGGGAEAADRLVIPLEDVLSVAAAGGGRKGGGGGATTHRHPGSPNRSAYDRIPSENGQVRRKILYNFPNFFDPAVKIRPRPASC